MGGVFVGVVLDDTRTFMTSADRIQCYSEKPTGLLIYWTKRVSVIAMVAIMAHVDPMSHVESQPSHRLSLHLRDCDQRLVAVSESGGHLP